MNELAILDNLEKIVQIQPESALRLLTNIRKLVETSATTDIAELLSGIRKGLIRQPDAGIVDFLSEGQVLSKMWIVNEVARLQLDLGLVYLCAGWYGSLARFLMESGIPFHSFRSFDIDDSATLFAEDFNRSSVLSGWQFKATTKDIFDIDYSHHQYWTKRFDGTEVEISEIPDTVVNTSCEHIDFIRWYNMIPKGKLVILQNNNYKEIDDHINCVDSVKEFGETAPMSNLLYEGELVLSLYSRYMRIGYK